MGEGGGGAETTVRRQAASGFPACPAFSAQPAVAAVQGPAGEEPAARRAREPAEREEPGGRSHSKANQSDSGGDAVGGKAGQGRDTLRRWGS